jgi:type II secretory pathway component GspD/PulD (secretin)
MGLKIGYFSQEHNFLALVDLLESKGYLKVLMNPSLEVVNGQKARIESSEKVPLEQVFLHDRDGFIETRTEYVDVVDALEITPHVFADGYIGLETTALIGSKNIPEGVKQIRIVSKREIYNKENRIRQGESLVIGGIRKSEEHSVVRGVPFFKDIPVIGVLFSSKDYEERAVETVFILTPTISTGGIPNQDMVEQLRRKHERPEYGKDLQDTIMDPLGFGASKQQHQDRLQELEEKHRQASIEKRKAEQSLREAQEEVEVATTAFEKARQEAAQAQQSAETEKGKATAATTEAEKARAEADRMKAKAEAVAGDDAEESHPETSE